MADQFDFDDLYALGYSDGYAAAGMDPRFKDDADYRAGYEAGIADSFGLEY